MHQTKSSCKRGLFWKKKKNGCLREKKLSETQSPKTTRRRRRFRTLHKNSVLWIGLQSPPLERILRMSKKTWFQNLLLKKLLQLQIGRNRSASTNFGLGGLKGVSFRNTLVPIPTLGIVFGKGGISLKHGIHGINGRNIGCGQVV